MGDNLEFSKIKSKISKNPPLLTCDMKIGGYFAFSQIKNIFFFLKSRESNLFIHKKFEMTIQLFANNELFACSIVCSISKFCRCIEFEIELFVVGSDI